MIFKSIKNYKSWPTGMLLLIWCQILMLFGVTALAEPSFKFPDFKPYTSKYPDITTKWTIGLDSSNKAYLKYQLVDQSGNPVNDSKPTPYIIKGVCYSPCPIGNANTVGENIGDWFWDNTQFKFQPGSEEATGTIFSWEHIWADTSNVLGGTQSREDIDKIQDLKCNAVRVYCMMTNQMASDGKSFNFTLDFTHQKFLDECYSKGLYVLVGIPLDKIFNQTNSISEDQWLKVFENTCKELNKHPAVMGITLLNETDGQGSSFPSSSNPTDPKVTYYWTKVEEVAKKLKTEYAPNKIVGLAQHDLMNSNQFREINFANLNLTEHLDFWGQNIYRSDLDALNQMFDGDNATQIGFNNLKNYAATYPNINKPVILTEYGWPSTGHKDPNDKASIYCDSSTAANTASYITRLFPAIYKQPICLGVYYFSFCDEWWQQPNGTGDSNIWTWYGGNVTVDFPNGYWDLDGFGLYGISKNPASQIPQSAEGQPNNWSTNYWYAPVWKQGPYPYFNPFVENDGRSQVRTALSDVFMGVNPSVASKAQVKMKGTASNASSSAALKTNVAEKANDSIFLKDVSLEDIDFEPSSGVRVSIGNLPDISLDTAKFKSNKKGYTYKNSGDDGKVILKVNTQSQTWSLKISKIDLDGINFSSGLDIYLKVGDQAAGGTFFFDEKVQLQYLANKNDESQLVSNMKTFKPISMKGSLKTVGKDKDDILNLRLDSLFEFPAEANFETEKAMKFVIDDLTFEIAADDWQEKNGKLIYKEKEDSYSAKVIYDKNKGKLIFDVNKKPSKGLVDASHPLQVMIFTANYYAKIIIYPSYNITLTQ